MPTKNSYAQAALRSFEETANAINALVANDIISIPLDIFKARLFPIVREWAVEKKTDNLIVWYNVSGGLNKRIKVMDNGNFAFYVPPPFTDIVLPKDRESVQNVAKIDSLNKLISMKEKDGETKEALMLSTKVNLLLNTESDKIQQSKHIIMLAKIWEYLGEPVSEILATAKVNLNDYDEDGSYSAKSDDTPVLDKALPNEPEEEDELSF